MATLIKEIMIIATNKHEIWHTVQDSWIACINNNNMRNSTMWSNLRKYKCETQSEEYCAVWVVAVANLRGKARQRTIVRALDRGHIDTVWY